MGQKTALMFKYWILTKRQKLACCCQMITPLMCLVLIKLVLYLIDESDLLPDSQKDAVVPSTIYPANLLTPGVNFQNSYFHVSNPKRINRWAAQDEQTHHTFANWLTKVPTIMKYTHMNHRLEKSYYPEWNYYDNSNDHEDIVDLMNQLLIQDIKKLNNLNTFQLDVNEILPDCAYLINSTHPEKGVQAHVQVNNILFKKFHRQNGDQDYGTLRYSDKYGMNVYKKQMLAMVTESSIAHINILSNIYLQSQVQNDLVNIISMISPTVDSSSIESFINSALSLITINLFPTALCLGFPIMLFVLVMEKEEKIKDLLDVNGLVTANYWITFFLYNFIQLQVTIGIFLLFGKLWVNIDFFEKSSYILIFWYLSAWNCSQIGFALFASLFIKRSSMATLVGYTISIFLILFLSMISQFLFPNPGHIPYLFYLFPQASLVRFFYLSISRCIDFECLATTSDLFKGEMGVVVIVQHLVGVMYFAIGLLYSEPKFMRMVKGFFSSMRIKKKEPNTVRRGTQRTLSSLSPDLLDGKTISQPLMLDDIGNSGIDFQDKHSSAIAYEERVKLLDPEESQYVLIAKNMSKSYPCSQGIKRALSNFSLKIEKGKIFGLLGPNGAGKTTFLSVLTGTQLQDEGEAWICGNDTSDRSIHTGNIGFCPQFDILWPLLNVEEHLIFLAMFKGIKKEEAKESVMELIKEVDLERDYKKYACQLSGGMKRRCSLAMALTGDPRIIFLDEPSSGLDPVKRRHFWSLIKKTTEDRAVLLTTHLMEEADTLCNDIGIITTGKLRCVGNSIFLKTAFTEGMKIQVDLDPKKIGISEFMKSLKSKIPSARLESEFQGTLIIIIKDNNSDGTKEIHLSSIFEVMYGFISDDRQYIRDWSISLGSLEDVFLTVVKTYRESNIEPIQIDRKD